MQLIHLLIAVPSDARWADLPEETRDKLKGEKVLFIDTVGGTRVAGGFRLIQIVTAHRPAVIQNFLADPENGITDWVVVWAHDIYPDENGDRVVYQEPMAQALNLFADIVEYDENGDVVSTRRPTFAEAKARLHRWDIPEMHDALS
jgi:hypothetical protein